MGIWLDDSIWWFFCKPQYSPRRRQTATGRGSRGADGIWFWLGMMVFDCWVGDLLCDPILLGMDIFDIMAIEGFVFGFYYMIFISGLMDYLLIWDDWDSLWIFWIMGLIWMMNFMSFRLYSMDWEFLFIGDWIDIWLDKSLFLDFWLIGRDYDGSYWIGDSQIRIYLIGIGLDRIDYDGIGWMILMGWILDLIWMDCKDWLGDDLWGGIFIGFGYFFIIYWCDLIIIDILDLFWTVGIFGFLGFVGDFYLIFLIFIWGIDDFFDGGN